MGVRNDEGSSGFEMTKNAKKNMPNTHSTSEAVQILRNGGTVVYPTETAYGLGADATNANAVKKVFAIKGRAPDMAVPIIVRDLAHAQEIAHFSKKALALAREFWPGPLTLVLPEKKQAGLAKWATQKGYVALRVSSHHVSKELASGLGRPIVSTSANRSGCGSCFDIECVRKQFAGSEYQPDYIIDAGKLPDTKLSTIIRVVEESVEVLRQGEIKLSKHFV
ncbi:MAG: hypothetical protein ACD_76C00079G0003 [uncultured bacterium]|nr:MAG: hypothetical protein ACD_76C00079G0003 [uncultured bacterium]HBD05143.1 threonylcarbamoyl-AMP synthase [Candidatus Uhrbacteria bacterium]